MVILNPFQKCRRLSIAPAGLPFIFIHPPSSNYSLYAFFAGCLCLIADAVVIKWLNMQLPGVIKITFLLTRGRASAIFFPFVYANPTPFCIFSQNYYILFLKNKSRLTCTITPYWNIYCRKEKEKVAPLLAGRGFLDFWRFCCSCSFACFVLIADYFGSTQIKQG